MSNLINILVPDISDSVKISKILKEKGSLVKKYDVIAVCEGDSIEIEIKSDVDGVIKKISVKEGDTVSSNSVIAKLIPSENFNNKDDRVLADRPENLKEIVDENKDEKNNPEELCDEETKIVTNIEQTSKGYNMGIDKDNIVKKEEIIDVIKSKDDDVEEVGKGDKISKKPYRIVPFLKNLFKISKSESVNVNLYDYYRYLDLSYITESLEEFSEDYKRLFGMVPKIDPFFIKVANIVLKKTERFKVNKVNYVYKSADKTILNYVDNISKKKYSEIQEIVSKENNIKNSDNILKLIFNYKNGFMKSNSPNCIVFNGLDNDKDVIVSYSSLLDDDNSFYDTFFRCLENPAWIMLDIML